MDTMQDRIPHLHCRTSPELLELQFPLGYTHPTSQRQHILKRMILDSWFKKKKKKSAKSRHGLKRQIHSLLAHSRPGCYTMICKPRRQRIKKTYEKRSSCVIQTRCTDIYSGKERADVQASLYTENVNTEE